MTLYNRPVSSGIAYFFVNMRESSDIIGRESIGHAKHKLKIKVWDNEEAIKNGVEFEAIDIEWMFVILRPYIRNRRGNP